MRRRDLLYSPLLAALPLGSALPLPGRARAQCGSVAPLLHRRIARERLLHMSLWNERDHAWRRPQPTESLATGPSVQILHLWADWCLPCVQEMPLLQRLSTRLRERCGLRARLSCVAEITLDADMDRFLSAHRQDMPPGPYFQDTAERLSTDLLPFLPQGRLSLPLSLVIDGEHVIRYAVLGSLADASPELLPLCQRLVELASTPPSTPSKKP
jgi:thiol-disulfide isomerase/thioredoxin